MDYNFGNPYLVLPLLEQRLPEPPSCPEGRIYIVRPGDTLYQISSRYNIRLQALVDANPQITNPNVLTVGQRICIPISMPSMDEKLISSKVCRVFLTPNIKGALGGVSFINYDTPTLWITTFGLPAPNTLAEQYTAYKTWLIDRKTDRYLKIDMQPVGLPGIEAGYERINHDMGVYDEIIVTAEASPSPPTAQGIIVLKGSLKECNI